MGTSCSGLTRVCQIRDHPHAYGDKGRSSSKTPCYLGSSPRVWGQVIINRLFPNVQGIIPTRMGTRYADLQRFRRRWDHPHAYGDKSSGGSASTVMPGSSPRVWGQDASLTDTGRCARIIPTRMGTR